MILNKVIIAPDSFKGVLSAREVTDVIADVVWEVFPNCVIIKMPIADGGEGSVDAILSAVGGEVFEAVVRSPDDRQISASFGIAFEGKQEEKQETCPRALEEKQETCPRAFEGKQETCPRAFIEMAQSSGITRQEGLHPMSATTFGFGQLILAAFDKGAREFTLCIGGSASTDGGCGMAAALGVRFFDSGGVAFIPCGESLCDIAEIDRSGLDARVAESSFTVMCDVDNPLFGESGAAFVYGPQKGASPEQVLLLDAGLSHYGFVLSELFGRCFSDIPGAGAAGGLGAGCMAFLGAGLRSGIDAILELYDFKRVCPDADLVITGEGKLDSQSFQGKVLSGILREAGDVPVWSICGVNDCDEEFLREKGLVVFEASEGVSAEESMREPVKYLRIAVQRALMSIRVCA